MRKFLLIGFISTLTSVASAKNSKAVDSFFSNLLGLHQMKGSQECEQISVIRDRSTYSIKSQNQVLAIVTNYEANVAGNELLFEVVGGSMDIKPFKMIVNLVKAGHQISSLKISRYENGEWWSWKLKSQTSCFQL